MWCKNYEFSQRGALCEKDRGWWQREGEPHRGGLQLVSMPSVRRTVHALVCVCVARAQAREWGPCAFINAETVQACGHGDKRKNKIKATNMHPLPRWASFSQKDTPGSLLAPLARNLRGYRVHRQHTMPTTLEPNSSQGQTVALWICPHDT